MAGTRIVQSLARGLEIMQRVAQSENGITLRDLCLQTGLHAPTAHNLLRTLVVLNYLEKVRGPVRYRLGRSAVELVAQHNDNALMFRASRAMPELFRQLQDVLYVDVDDPREPRDSTVVLARVIGGDVMMVMRVSPARPTLLERPHQAHHPYASAVALTYQAFCSEEELAGYRDRYPLWQHGLEFWGTAEDLDTFLSEVRELGYAAPNIHAPEVLRIAVPVFGNGHELLAILGAGRWKQTSQGERQKHIEMALNCAHRIGKS